MVRVGINGFGRIGRLSMRAAWDMPELQIVHVNEVKGGASTAAYMREGGGRLCSRPPSPRALRGRQKPSESEGRRWTARQPSESDRPSQREWTARQPRGHSKETKRGLRVRFCESSARGCLRTGGGVSSSSPPLENQSDQGLSRTFYVPSMYLLCTLYFAKSRDRRARSRAQSVP